MQIFKKLFALLLVLLFSAAIITAAEGLGKTKDGKNYLPGKIVVKLKSDGMSNSVNRGALSAVIAQISASNAEPVFDNLKNYQLKYKLNLQNVFQLDVSIASDIEELSKQLEKESYVEYAEPSYVDRLDATVDDPLYSSQQHLPQVNAEEAWDISFGSSDVIIGILDTGVDWDHEDLERSIWSNEDEIADNGIDDDANGYIDDIRGWDFVTGITNAYPGEDANDPDNDPMDFDGHGTHVAGLAAAETDNGVGVATLAGGASIMPLRVGWHGTDGLGYVNSTFAAQAYTYAADNGARVTNQSSGNSGQVIIDAAFYAFQNNVIIFESAGNSDDNTPSALGSQTFVMSVAAVDDFDEKAYYSSFGEYVDISSPGGEFQGSSNGLLSTVVFPSDFYGGAKYARFQGTSMAAPFAASLAALILSHEPELDNVDLYTRMQESADTSIYDINPDYEGLLGAGRIDAYQALISSAVAEPYFMVVNWSVDDSDGNNNGKIDPGETVTYSIDMINKWQNAQGVSVTLSTDETWPLTVSNPTVVLGDVPGIKGGESSMVTADFTVTAAADAIPLAVPFNLEMSGSGFSKTVAHSISISPNVLVVADFDQKDFEIFDFSAEYREALAANDIPYDLVYYQDGVNQTLLNKYTIVIWGCEWSFPSLERVDRDMIDNFLQNGGSFFLSGQDIGWELNESTDNVDVDFFNNVLTADYLGDDAGTTIIYGVDGDPITDGFEIEFLQKRRAFNVEANSQQYPDIIEPINGSQKMLQYANTQGGAVRYDGDHRLIYFGFAGFEAINGEYIRELLMNRIVNWLSGIDLYHNPLGDTEDTENDYLVTVELNDALGSIDSVFLFYDAVGSPPYSKVLMNSVGDGMFEGYIPAQSEGTTVDYLIFAKSTSGNFRFSDNLQFHVGADNEAPTLALLNSFFETTVNPFGPAPFEFQVELKDNMGIDPASAKIYFWAEGVEQDSSLLTLFGSDVYTGTFEFAEPLLKGTEVSYYFYAEDSSSNRNSDTSDTYSFIIDTTQVIDDFENGTAFWDLGTGWGLNSTQSNSGNYSIDDSPSGNYNNNEDNPLTLMIPFNLSVYQYAQLSFFMKYTIENGKDTLFVEASNDDGVNWNPVANFTGVSFSFREKTADLSNYTGPGNESVWVRYRMVTDESGVQIGVWLDDVSIDVSYDSVTAVNDDLAGLPEQFQLKQNYPNPFNPTTTIRYAVPVVADITVKIFDVLGREVTTLINNQKIDAGYHEVNWNGMNQYGQQAATGVYFYRIEARGVNGQTFVESRKMMLLK
ncbi:MAG: S8 family serine peptidase [Melioribacteraceae bacterium]|nr:S8 family serine peptidase [Melioribacteraceae bacterium]MCF8354484.1 S8 family serine peptidase [Melioribacteraceae bacterium]MCF8394094.1 S8 family serine peptidase [Melioribacteraceae bacterium]MCF8419854.1 S8 family serine peptidase [Melioribacteraceae bacterium]